MSNIDKQDLLRAAVKIGAHTWGAEGPQVFSMSNGTADALVLEVFGDETSGQQDCDIASFIALANPSTVLALLDELEAAEKRIAELEAKLETADKLQDSAFRHGLQHGFSLGQTDNQAGFEECLSAYGTRSKDNG